jgi:hypothetical protein
MKSITIMEYPTVAQITKVPPAKNIPVAAPIAAIWPIAIAASVKVIIVSGSTSSLRDESESESYDDLLEDKLGKSRPFSGI